MIDIGSQFNKTVSTQRLTAISVDPTIGDEKYEEYLTGVDCEIQPLDESITEDLSGSFGKDFLMFAYVNDIIEGDKIIDGTDEYRVVGVENYNFLGEDRHMEIRIRKFNH